MNGERPVSKILGSQVDQSKLSNNMRKSAVQFANKDGFDQEVTWLEWPIKIWKRKLKPLNVLQEKIFLLTWQSWKWSLNN